MEPYDNPFWEKSNLAERREKRERRETNAINSGNFVSVKAHATTRTNVSILLRALTNTHGSMAKTCRFRSEKG